MPHTAAIGGSSFVCVGASITLTDATSGGAWLSSDNAVASIDGTGGVSGVSAGSDVIFYIITNSCGSDTARHTLTVNPLPDAGINVGPSEVCEGANITLTNSVAGGFWTSDVPNMTVVSGVVTGVTAGTGNIIYTVVNSCGTDTAVNTITINPAPHAGTVNGPSLVCVGSSVTLTDAAAGGAWSASNGNAMVTGGVVTGVIAGIDTIIYTVNNSCGTDVAMHIVTINAVPDLAPIGGLTDVCVGASITLTNATNGGAWSVLNANASINAATGEITGVIAGIDTAVYIVANTCGADTAAVGITIHPLPGAITGTNNVAAGASITLSNSVAGGVWSSSNDLIAAVDASGTVSGVAPGSAVISYSTGCSTPASLTVYVTGMLSGYTGPDNATVCNGSPATFNIVFDDPFILFDAFYWTVSTNGGVTYDSIFDNSTYSGTNSFNLTVNATSAMNGYLFRAVGDGNISTSALLTVENALHAGTISGAASMCIGSQITLVDATPGGMWSESTGATTVTDGVVTAITTGYDDIYYVVSNSCGPDTATHNVIIDMAPDAGSIAGADSVCVSATTDFINMSATGGTWSSSNAGIATIDPLGTVTGVAGGLATISYSLTSSCGSASVTHDIFVNPLPDAGSIVGLDSVCQGAMITLTDAVPGGTWSSTDPGIADVDAAGVVTGVASGSIEISYTVSTFSCGSASVSHLVTTIPPADAGAITGADSVCVNGTVALLNGAAGGTWSSSDPGIATVDASGIVSGVATGLATITYTSATSCGSASVTHNVFVNPLPAAGSIAGLDSVCSGATITLTDAVAGGVWSSTDGSVAAVDASGAVTGGTAGTATISYSISTFSCGSIAATHIITTNPLPDAGTISGADSVCVNATIPLTNVVVGGTWITSDAGIASVDASGVVTGVSQGTTTILYRSSTFSCGSVSDTHVLTVNPLPDAGAIAGLDSVCSGSMITLADIIADGIWSSADGSIAAVDASGVVTGGTSGVTTISYTVSSFSCGSVSATHSVTTSPLPDAGAIAGADSVCVNATIALANVATGGAWSSSDMSVATVDASGAVSGVATGAVTISYTSNTPCGSVSVTHNVFVNPLPAVAPIIGLDSVCSGATITLREIVLGGTWSSADGSVAAVDASGVVTGGAAGATTISYTVSSFSCGSISATHSVVTSPLPDAGAIAGVDSVCANATIALSNAATGGAWSSSDMSIATVDASGVVSGVTTGLVTISYTSTTPCGSVSVTHDVFVNPLPDAGSIVGLTSVCLGATITLTDVALGGVWSSADGSIATVDASGTVSGGTAGTTTISYTVSSFSCGTASTTHSVTTNPLPDAGAITGADSVCVNATVSLSNVATGGAWSSSDMGIATVDASGVVSGVATGLVTISYTSTTPCGSVSVTHDVFVNPLPDAGSIVGLTSVCLGATITLTDVALGGVWSSADGSIATVDASGTVSGGTAGTTTISYTVSSFSCGTASATQSVTVNPLPDAGTITGLDSVCVNATITLSNTSTSGVWISLPGSIATISPSGVVTGVSEGIATIVYLSSAVCGNDTATFDVTVKALPDAGSIAGAANVCSGSMISLTDAAIGGMWSSTDGSIASVDASGVVSGSTAGVATISYTVSSFSCGSASATHSVTVNPLPDAGTITGSDSVCVNATITLSNTVSTGTWVSPLSSIATVSASGAVTGISPGAATIVYLSSNACGNDTATFDVIVKALPDAGTITGADTVVAGNVITLTDAAIGGAWSSTNVAIASVDAFGTVTGVTTGVATISYTVPSFSCGSAAAAHVVTVIPDVNAGAIVGADSVCAGATITLTNPTGTTGGTWSTALGIVSVDGFGVVTAGSTVGTDTVIYTVTSGAGSASTTHLVTVNPLPNAGAISGLDSVCAGATITLSNLATGGSWISSVTSVATVDAAGVVTGVAAGATTISYTAFTFSCGSATVTHNVVVNPLPNAGAITGLDSVCAGAAITLSNVATGGSWISSATSVATVDAAGIVTGVAAGTATISYTSSTFSCGSATVTHNVVVNPLPNAGTITGLDSVCAGATITLSNVATGGSWISSITTVATVNASGVVTGVAAGSTTISYTASTFSCGSATVTHNIVVNPLPNAGAITGLDSVCAGAAITLSNVATGGSWISSATSVATVDAAGIVTGVAAGSTTISYTASTFSCGSATVTHNVVVNPLPNAGAITGLDSVCAGATITLSNVATGGSWISSITTVATVNASGVVTGVAAGSTTISYTASTFSCGSATVTHNIVVNPLPNAGAITGLDSVCAGAAITLSNVATGGSWISSATSVATVDAAGIVTGVAAGSTTISYTASTFSCGSATVTHNVVANPLPNAGVITGLDSVCAGSSISLTNTVSGGSWSSSDVTLATVDASGTVTALSSGIVTISYTASTFSCGSAAATHDVTVNALPVVAPITGTAATCEGVTVVLGTTTVGGVWTTSDASVATIDASGVVVGGVAGTATISYTVTSSSACVSASSALFTVNPLPVLSAISGPAAVARLSSITLTDTASGGVWTSSNVSLAVVNSSTGVVTGVNMGTVIITYTKTNGFGCTSMVTYNLIVANSLTSSTILPTGSATLCHGNPVNLVTVTAGGATDLSYQWYIDGNLIPGATNANYVSDTFGYITVKISNLAGSNLLTGVTVVLPPNPVIGMTGANVLYTGSFSTYQWYMNGVAIPGATSSIYIETAFGDYTVVVSDGNGCFDTSAAYTINEHTGVVNVNMIAIKLYPNPATSVIKIDAPMPVNATVMTADGKVVIRSDNAASIDVSQLASGMYMVMIYDQNNLLLKTDKFIKVD